MDCQSRRGNETQNEQEEKTQLPPGGPGGFLPTARCALREGRVSGTALLDRELQGGVAAQTPPSEPGQAPEHALVLSWVCWVVPVVAPDSLWPTCWRVALLS